jgi:hypothetical protein
LDARAIQGSVAASKWDSMCGMRRRTYAGREPTWHDPTTLSQLSRQLALSIDAQVQGALSLPTRVFQHLPTVRNFYAHRNEDTSERLARVARALGLRPRSRATELMLSFAPARPQNVLADWIDEVRVVAETLCA